VSDESQDAAEHAKQAAGQGKAAAQNAAKAAKAAAEPVAEAVTDEVKDNAQKLNGTMHDAANAARRLDPNLLGHISGDMGLGFFALSVSIYAGVLAFSKFRQAASGSNQILQG
jgi:hypothetical protein